MSRRIREGVLARINAERGTIIKDRGGRITFALGYPNTYRVGMSNLGFQGIYGVLNDADDLLCERSFLPDPGERPEYGRTGTPLQTLETGRSLRDFHVVAFSVSFENDYPSILRMLDLAGIPRRATERTDREPLLILGGICTAYNPEPLADFFDLIFIGESEESLPRFIDLLREGPSQREALLHEAASIRGIYVPSLYAESYDGPAFLEKRHREPAPARVAAGPPADLSRKPFTTVIRTEETEFSGMGLVEGMRGCPWSCRFCVASHVYRPVRYRDRETLDGLVGVLTESFDRVGLVGPSLSEYGGIEDLIRCGKADFSISSIRAWGRSDGLIRALAQKGVRSLSIAPEAGSDRMRRAIGKKLTRKGIVETASLVLSEGIAQLRLYFMIGLPGEVDEDVAAIATLVKEIRATSKRGRIVLSVSSFVPKPMTPFQWMPMEREPILRDRLALLKRSLRGLPAVSLRHESPRGAQLEGFLARGDRRFSRILDGIADGKGWRQVARQAGFDPDIALHRVRSYDDALPWDFIDGAVLKSDLVQECETACRELAL